VRQKNKLRSGLIGTIQKIVAILLCASITVVAIAAPPTAPHPPTTLDSPKTALAETGSLSATAPQSKLAVEEIGPPLYYLPDQQGQLVPMFGFSYEQFMSVFRQLEEGNRRLAPPKFLIDRIEGTAIVQDDRAELDLTFEITKQVEGPICIPLGLGHAAIREAMKYQGPGKAFLKYNSSEGKYNCWLYGPTEDKHRLRIKSTIALTNVGEETRLEFDLPRATQSVWQLSIPIPGATTKTSDGIVLKKLESKDSKTDRYELMGLRGNGWISWSKPNRTRDDRANLLEATGQILVRINGYSVTSEATLSVRGHGEAFDRFRIRLPSGAKLVSGDTSEYQVVLQEEPQSKNDSKDPKTLEPIVEVRLPEKTVGPITIRLATRQPLEAVRKAQWAPLGSFTILEAIRQSGHLGILVAPDLFVSWFPERGIHQVEEIPESLKTDDSMVGFAYFAQPCVLRARVMPRKSRISVEPEYLVMTEEKRVDLEATLKYTIDGKKALVLDIDLGDWQFDSVGPENLVAADGVEVNDEGILSVPLLQPLTGRVELELKAHRPISPKAKSLSLRFPQPKVSSPGPAAVVVLPADNIQLKPDPKALAGLSRQQVAPPMSLPVRQQAPLFYRGELSGAVFAADFAVRHREVAIALDSRVTFEGKTAQVVQKLTYQIDYEPCDRLTFELPVELANQKDLTVLLDAQPVTLAQPPVETKPKPTSQKWTKSTTKDTKKDQPAQDDKKTILDSLPIPTPRVKNGPIENSASPESTPEMTTRFLALKSPRIGTCEISFHYSLPEREMIPDSSLIRKIPLVLPSEGELSGHRLTVDAPQGVQVSSQSTDWTLPGNKSALRNRSTPEKHLVQTWTTSKRLAQATLGLFLESRNEPEAIVVRRALVQTWLDSNTRQDRAIFRFSTTRSELELQLPGIATKDVTECFVDGRPQSITFTTDGHLKIPLVASSTKNEQVLELRYHGPCVRPGRGRFEMKLPSLADGTWTDRLYWQLILPPNEHLLSASSQLIGEHRWQRDGLFWNRRPLLDSASLELWIGSSPSNVFSTDAGYYLLGSFGETTRVSLYTASRSWIVLIGSGIALVIGLVLIYLPWSRHPVSLLIGVIAIAAIGLSWPEPSVLLMQASVLGLAMILLAGLLERTMSRRRRTISVLDSGSSILDHDTTQTLPIDQLQKVSADATKLGHGQTGPLSGKTATTPPTDTGDESQSTDLTKPGN
jgi:hypothetical protein